MEERYGFPIVTAETVYDFLKSQGIVRWEHACPTVDLEMYRQSITSEADIKEFKRFAPKSEVVFLKDPRNGLPYRGFRVASQKDGTSVFTLLPGDLVPVAGEFKHGTETISLLPPGGNFTAADRKTNNPASNCGKREFEEETGIVLKECISLGTPSCQPRAYTERWYPCLGIPEEPIIQRATKKEQNELLQIVLFPLSEWWKIITSAQVDDASSYVVTLLALARLGKISI